MNKSLLIKIPVAAAFVVVLLQLSGACDTASIEPGKVEAASAYPEPSRTAIAEVVKLPRVEEAVGTVTARTQVHLASEVAGRVLEVLVQEGQRVSRGAVVARLDDRGTAARIAEAQSGLASAEAAQELATAQVERMRRLVEREVGTKVELENAEAAWRQATASVAAAREGVRQVELLKEFSEVVAPTDGVVAVRSVDPGDLAAPGQTLVMLQGEDGLQLEAAVRESLAASLGIGAELEVNIPAVEMTVRAVVREKQTSADTRTRTVVLKFDLPELEELQAGMFGTVSVPSGIEVRLLVPREAVRTVGQLHTMLIEEGEGRWSRRHVRIGRVSGERVEILSGLTPGMRFGWDPAVAE